MDPNVVFGDVPVQAHVHSAQHATPDEVVGIAKAIWAEIKNSGVSEKDPEGNKRLLNELQEKYIDFTRSFPLVLRWMVQLRQFREKAFRRYLLKHTSAKLDTHRDYLGLQADYLVLLYGEIHPHSDQKRLQAYRESVLDQLLEEHEEFEDLQRQVEAELKLQADSDDRNRLQELYKYLICQKVLREGPPDMPGA